MREAVARCPECKQCFCRECITEHDDRVVCSACLKKLASVPLNQRRGFITFKRCAQFVVSVVAAWFFFFLVGDGLSRLPAEFHEGTLWKAPWLDR